jgi:DNA ligase 1
VTFLGFCALCQELAGTRSRLAKTSATSSFLRQLSPDEIRSAVAFLGGRTFPASDPRTLDVSWTSLSKVLKGAPAPPAAASLTISGVGKAFESIAEAAGTGSRRAKEERLQLLFADATLEEREILPRILLGEMRIGLHDGLILEAIAEASKTNVSIARRAAMFMSDLSEVAHLALAQGGAALAEVGVRLFVPLLPMLAEPTEDFDEVLAAHGDRSALEYKYDGARIQIHKHGAEVRIWSRRLTEVTASLPEIVEIATRDLAGESFILDGEVVAVGARGRPLPFQELMRRFRRVHDIETISREVPVVLHLFDCLFVDGRSLVDETYLDRWKSLEKISGGNHLAKRTFVSNASEAKTFFEGALAAGHEGVVAKDPSSPYTPGSRGKKWFKVKVADTVDCAIIAVDRGSGRRQGWLSNFHLAVADGAGGFAPVGKTFKGLTDEEFRMMTTRLRELQTGDNGYTVTVRPQTVVEVAYNEIQRSPQYSSGLALRFARISRIRDDKSPDQVTTLGELRERYERQFTSKGRADI